ncbi:MAG: NADH-quinone oxidoreductase subunit J [Alphaproteobacteria bacterium]
MTALAFYLFAAICIGSAAMVVFSRNPVHSVLFLILAFFNAAGLMVLLGAEFVGMLLVIVYVGAVAVLFLFVVMMLDVNFEELRKGIAAYLPVGALVGLILVGELILVFTTVPAAEELQGNIAYAPPEGMTNTEALGQVLYTEYALAFQGAGMVLLVAMIGAIVLTLRHRPGVRRQSVADQVSRTREQTIAIRKVEPGKGA